VAARLAGRQPVLTFVTIGELTQWTRLRHWGPHSIASLDAWLADKPVLPAARSVAMRWGELSAAATQRGRPRPVNDSWVAACCLSAASLSWSPALPCIRHARNAAAGGRSGKLARMDLSTIPIFQIKGTFFI
jgi:hypothetical protein